MCGRYTIVAKAEEIEKRFEVEVPEFYIPRYNAAPTQILPVITNTNQGGLSFFQWGLIPKWAKDASIGSKMINARSETIHEKPAFKYALQKQRCLVLADGFYEWKRNKQDKTKMPYRITLEDNSLFAMAGLWENFIDEDENNLYSFTIITTTATRQMTSLHDRMPIILGRETEKKWLDDKLSLEDHKSLLKSLTPQPIRTYPVSTRVNSARNEESDLILPAKRENPGGTLPLFE